MSNPVSYPVPWRLIFNLWPNMLHRTPTSVDSFSASICALHNPPALIFGLENLRFPRASSLPPTTSNAPASGSCTPPPSSPRPSAPTTVRRPPRPLDGHRQLAPHQTRPPPLPLPRRQPPPSRRRRPRLLPRLLRRRKPRLHRPQPPPHFARSSAPQSSTWNFSRRRRRYRWQINRPHPRCQPPALSPRQT